jgi:RNA polymerase sigma-70 factor (ECF subfamily)
VDDLSTYSDDELIARIAAGDEVALTTIYQRRHPAVYRFALHMSGSTAIAEDVTQDTFLLLLREPGQYDPRRGSLVAFLYGIARNLVRRAAARSSDGVELADFEAVEPAFPAELARRQEIEALRQAVLALPAHYREAVVLCDLHEMNYEDAAQAIGCSVGTVRSRLHRGRSLLIEKMRRAQEPVSKKMRCFA